VKRPRDDTKRRAGNGRRSCSSSRARTIGARATRIPTGSMVTTLGRRRWPTRHPGGSRTLIQPSTIPRPPTMTFRCGGIGNALT
jgi:hypothetical protein